MHLFIYIVIDNKWVGLVNTCKIVVVLFLLCVLITLYLSLSTLNEEPFHNRIMKKTTTTKQNN